MKKQYITDFANAERKIKILKTINYVFYVVTFLLIIYNLFILFYIQYNTFNLYNLYSTVFLARLQTIKQISAVIFYLLSLSRLYVALPRSIRRYLIASKINSIYKHKVLIGRCLLETKKS